MKKTSNQVDYTSHDFCVLILQSCCCRVKISWICVFVAGHSVVVEVSPDIHICGFCKQQYNNFDVFLAHKRNGCSLPTSDTTAITPAAPLAGIINNIDLVLLPIMCFQTCFTVCSHIHFLHRFQCRVCFRGNLPDLRYERCQKDPDQSTENTFQKSKTFPDFKETQLLFLRSVPLALYDCNTFLLIRLPSRGNGTSCNVISCYLFITPLD